MWQPDRAVRGPFSPTEKDVPALNRLFAEAFTDRYRRDGLVGVRVPFLNPVIWRYALDDAGSGAMIWRDEADRLIAFNIAHKSGVEGWMGPLAVRPDRQTGGQPDRAEPSRKSATPTRKKPFRPYRSDSFPTIGITVADARM